MAIIQAQLLERAQNAQKKNIVGVASNRIINIRMFGNGISDPSTIFSLMQIYFIVSCLWQPILIHEQVKLFVPVVNQGMCFIWIHVLKIVLKIVKHVKLLMELVNVWNVRIQSKVNYRLIIIINVFNALTTVPFVMNKSMKNML